MREAAHFGAGLIHPGQHRARRGCDGVLDPLVLPLARAGHRDLPSIARPGAALVQQEEQRQPRNARWPKATNAEAESEQMPVPPPRQPLLALCCAALLAAAAAAAGAPSGEAARLAEVNALKDTIHRLPAKEAARRFAALTARGAPPPRQDAIDHFVVLCKPAPAGHLAPACSLAAAAAWLGWQLV